jgi:alpha-1,2-mannosyltransferase
MSTDSGARFWNTARRKQAAWLIVVLGGGIVISQWVRVFNDNSSGDVQLHYNFGHRFVTGEFLYNGGHTPYPPFWGMANAPWSFLPRRWAQVLAYPIGVVSLAFLIYALDRMTRRTMPLAPHLRFWATVAALALASRFIIRELPECGPNLLMVALAWGGILLWREGRDWLGGASLGLAIALKCTPALFLPYFALKRQWKLLAAASIFTALFTLAPIVRLGSASYERHIRTWLGSVSKGLSNTNPSIGVLGEEEVWNVSLRPTLGRFLMHLPDGHKGKIDSAWRAEWLNLEPRVAGYVVKATLLALLGFVAWQFRRPVVDRQAEAIAWEAAAVSLLILLVSPITWKQHCVGVFPAFYLVTRLGTSERSLPRWILAFLSVYVVVLLVADRGVIGRDLTLSLDSFGTTTWAILLLLGIVMVCHTRRARVDGWVARTAHGPYRGRVVEREGADRLLLGSGESFSQGGSDRIS